MRVSFTGTPSKEALRSRLRRFPREVKAIVNAGTRRHVENYEATLDQGVKKANLGLTPLARRTITAKRRRGARRVKTPMMEAGSLLKQKRIYRTKRGYRLRPYGKHRRSGIQALKLWGIHAAGSSRLPARNPWRRTLLRYHRAQLWLETNKDMSCGIRNLLVKGKGGAA